ncbi:MAG TPA: TrbG/VirB9 family P-type conjugative transfer protein [Hyphomonadaceae bacterium]|nr:TrbG/VirB9 family P-type conjugative transfer protein [Hyphomonadaceae bacterium]
MTLRTAAVALLALGLVQAADAQGASSPHPGPGDPRIKEFLYDPNAIVQIKGRLGYEMTIEFSPTERIENVSIGDSLSWQVTPNRKATLLFLKPMTKGNPTSMTVVTNERIYSFTLTAVDAKAMGDSEQLMRLRFLYPPPPPPPPPPPAPPPPPVKPQVFNFEYSNSGEKKLYPVRVFDDGDATFFQFDPKKDAPAIFFIAPDGKEEMANTRISGAYTVADLTAEIFVLRYGKTSAKIKNNAWSKAKPPAAAPLPPPRGG